MEMTYSETWVLQSLKGRIEMSSQKEVARSLKVTPQYINDVLKRRRHISAPLAKKLGYRRIIVFEKAQS